MNSEVEKYMQACGVRQSPVRTLIVKTLMQSSRPLSALELETMLETVDRSSITRTLAMLASHGAVHCIEDGSGSVRYEICHAMGGDGDNDLHVHFHCDRCGDTICLEDVIVPRIDLPEGYQAMDANFVIKGHCPKCNK